MSEQLIYEDDAKRVYQSGEGLDQSERVEWFPGREPLDVPSTRLAARLSVVDKVRAEELDDDTVSQLAPLFPPLAAGLDVKAGEVYAWDGTLVEALQPHTVEAWWLDLASLPPSLYKTHRTDDGSGPIEWQPGISVTTTDQVWYDGVLYDVIQAHTTQEGWTPPATPALFTPVEV